MERLYEDPRVKGRISMSKRIGFTAAVVLVAGLSTTIAFADHDDWGFGHGDHHDHHGHHDHDDHGSGFGIHFGNGFGIHYDEGDHDDYYHDDYHHHRYHDHSDWHDSGWQFLVPYYDRHYHGTYYRDGGVNYYVPRSYAVGSRAAAKPVEIEFGGYAHVDELSARLERQVNELCLDLHHNYRHNQGFAATYREAYEILKTAKHIHAKENQGDQAEVARRLDAVDGLFHHVRDDVKSWSRRQRRQIGQGGAQTKLDAVEATLHHLMHDVGVAGSHDAPDTAPAEVAPPPAN
jgi:hypothetical protein